MGIPNIPPSSSIAGYRDSLRSKRKSILDSTHEKLAVIAPEESAEISYDDFHKFHEEILQQEDQMRRSFEEFTKTLEAPPSVKEENPKELEQLFTSEKEELEQLEWQLQLDIIRKKAQILTRCFWTQVKKLSLHQESLSSETFQEMNRIFRSVYHKYGQLLHDAPRTNFSQSIVNQAKELEIKEDLLLASLEFRKHYAAALRKTGEQKSMFESEETLKTHPTKRLLQLIPKVSEEGFEYKLAEYLEKKRVTSPEKIADFSLYLASITPSSKIHPSAAHLKEMKATGIAGGALSVLFGIPAAILSTRSFYRSFSTFCNKKQLQEETKEVQHTAHALVEQGRAFVTQAQKILQSSHDEKELENAHELMTCGQRLEVIGIEIEQKAKMALEELHLTTDKAPQKLMTISLAVFAEGAKSVFGISEILNHAEKGFEELPISHALHAVGIAGGIAGVVVGGIQSYHSYAKMQKLEKKIQASIERTQELSKFAKENSEVPKEFLLLETTKNDYEFLTAKTDYAFAKISLANSIILVVAGILGVAALIAAPISGGLSIAVIVVVLGSSIIAIIQFFRRRYALKKVDILFQSEAKENQARYESFLKYIQQLDEKSKEMKILCDYYHIPEEDLLSFRRSPIVFLRTRYKDILHESK